ncbi:MAG: MOSC domain-containing protein [Gammaproteobacteria bacterium]|nr:MOSC domain-containing protein [Gammaproteobacteria bacterium]MCP5199022.1 MOSC domain-containing protein [Gammaproteobacteria bacterium]
MRVAILALYRATAAGAFADGTASGIFKTPVAGPVQVGREGLDGDFHADRSVHGGPDQALHHFPAEHYPPLAAAFPRAAAALVPGSIGENLTTHGLAEHDVCIGDVYAVGAVRLQVTAPRRPCWKIDRRYDARGMAAHIIAAGLTGWYYRVLDGGWLEAGAPLECVERPAQAPSVAAFHAALRATRPPAEVLERLAALAALPVAWQRRLRARLDWLRRHP